MNWIVILGIILISGGMFLFNYGQDLKNRLVNQFLHESISENINEVDQLVNSNNKLHSKADKYGKSLSGKDETIHQLTEQVDKQNVVTKEYQKSLSEKDETIHQLTEQVDKQNVATEEYQKSISAKDTIIHWLTTRAGKSESAEEYKENLSKKGITTKSNFSNSKQLSIARKETGNQDLSEADYMGIIAYARTLYNEGKYDEAYMIADDLRQKNSDSGLAYLILGTTEMHNKHYDKGEMHLNEAVKLGLSDKDQAWAFHNLGISSVQKENYDKAVVFLEKSVALNPNSEKTKKALGLLSDYMQRKSLIKKARSLCEMGKYDDAYRIADEMREKYPEEGLPYFILGIIEMRKEHYDKGEDLLNKAAKLKQSDEDKAWVFHNLGVSSARKNNFEKARGYFAKAVKLNPNMQESKKALKQLNN